MEKLFLKTAEFALRQAVLDVFRDAKRDNRILRSKKVSEITGINNHVVYGVFQALEEERQIKNFGYACWILNDED